MQSGLLLHVAFILRGEKLVWFGFGPFVLFPFWSLVRGAYVRLSTAP
jgi:hypothetical protein